MRLRVLVAVIAGWVVLLFALHWVLLSLVKPSFIELESRFALNDLNRVQGAFAADLESLGNSVKDYSTWDDMYAFAQKPTPEFIASDLHESMLGTLKIDLFTVYDEQDRPIFSRAGHPATGIPHRFIEADPIEFKNRFPILAINWPISPPTLASTRM